MKTTLKAKMAILVLGCIILSSGCMSTLEMLDEVFLETEQVASSKNGYAIGTYDTTYGMMELFQNGNMISGTYTGHTGTGTVEGLLDGNTLRGTWRDEDANGRIAFVFNPDMSKFSGYWSYNDLEPKAGSGDTWVGNRTAGSSQMSASSKPAAQPVPSSQAPRLLGSYDTTYGLMELSQNGNRISGTYTGYSGTGTVEGVLEGNTLRGTWRDEDAKGRIAFAFAPDMSTFLGYWSYNDLEPNAGSGDTWVGNRTGSASKMVASQPVQTPLQVGGTYETGYGNMQLHQNGNKVSGTYKSYTGDGSVEGTLQGNVLIGTWKDSRSSGQIRFVFSEDERAFAGFWSYGSAVPNQDRWDGYRIGNTAAQTPVAMQPQAAAQPVQAYQASRVLGSYDTTFGMMELSQSGNRINGTYTGHTGTGTVEGVLEGNTLRGTWKDEDAKGRIAFVFAPDMSTFSGYWSYNDLEPNAGSGDTWVGNRTGDAPPAVQQKSSAAPAKGPLWDISGTYSTDFGMMELMQDGTSVQGTYSTSTGTGTLEGTLDGLTIWGTWHEGEAYGRIRFVFPPDRSKFTGYWSYRDIDPRQNLSSTDGGTWDGIRQ